MLLITFHFIRTWRNGPQGRSCRTTSRSSRRESTRGGRSRSRLSHPHVGPGWSRLRDQSGYWQVNCCNNCYYTSPHSTPIRCRPCHIARTDYRPLETSNTRAKYCQYRSHPRSRTSQHNCRSPSRYPKGTSDRPFLAPPSPTLPPSAAASLPIHSTPPPGTTSGSSLDAMPCLPLPSCTSHL